MDDTWAVIMAGGDGSRLRSLTRAISGDDRPKQFCQVFGSKTLLGHTRERISTIFANPRTAFIVNAAHDRYYSAELCGVDPSRVIVQPSNKGTAAAILYSVIRISRIAEGDPLIAFLPCDHHYNNDQGFVTGLTAALAEAHNHRSALMLLGVVPHYAETDYGWIECGDLLGNNAAVRRVKRFWEKPSPEDAAQLFRQGCLWNTFIMLGRASAFAAAFKQVLPGIWKAFRQIEPCQGAQDESEAAVRLYERLYATDFSRSVLSMLMEQLIVMKLADVSWTDLGKPERVFIATAAQPQTRRVAVTS